MIVKLGSDQEIHRITLSLPIGKEQCLAPLIVKLVGMLLDADDRLGELVELAGILADRAEQRHRLQYQVCRLHDDLAHLLHLDLEPADLEQRDVLCGLVHLVDGVVERGGERLNVGAIEGSNEGAAHGGQDLARDFVSFGFVLENPFAIILGPFAVVEQLPQRLGTGDDDRGMPHEQVEKAVFPGHQRLKPAEHGCLAFCGFAPR